MAQSELVSIVCPTFNASKYIAATIESVRAQHYQNFELLIVDDCSTDNTAEVISPYLFDQRIRLIRQEVNHGAAVTRNRAIELSTGRFIAFLDSDDFWHPQKLSAQVTFMVKHGYSFTYTEFDLIDEDGVIIGASQKLQDSVTYRELLKHCIIQNSTVIYDVSTHGKAFCPLIRRRQDFGLFLNLLRNGERANLVINDAGEAPRLASYRLRSGSISSNKLKNIPMQWSIYREFEKLSLPQSAFFTLHWVLKSGQKNFERWLRKLDSTPRLS